VDEHDQYEGVWIILAEVEALSCVSGFGHGERAFVNVLSFAYSRQEACRVTRQAIAEAGFHTVALRETEKFGLRVRHYEVHEQVLALARDAARTRQVQFDVFSTWANQG